MAEWSERNKRIVLGVNDQCRDANALDEGQGTRLRVVITGVSETKRRRDETSVNSSMLWTWPKPDMS